MDPTKIVDCKNEAFKPIDAYDRGKNASLGGPIARATFEADYTLVVVRVTNEENCAFQSRDHSEGGVESRPVRAVCDRRDRLDFRTGATSRRRGSITIRDDFPRPTTPRRGHGMLGR
jgi:hypothetical protein